MFPLKGIQFCLKVLITFILILIGINSEDIDIQTISYEEYIDYYSRLEEIRRYNESLIKEEEDLPSLWEAFSEFIIAFYVSSAVIAVLLLCCVGCCIAYCVLKRVIMTMFPWLKLIEMVDQLPYFSHEILTKRLKEMRKSGVYIRPDGTKEFYKPIEDEEKIIERATEGLQS